MGYPYGDTYLEQIQKNKQECKEIVNAYIVLRNKYSLDNHKDGFELSIREQFAILGEALEVASTTVGDISDAYHFMWDVLDELFEKKYADYSDDSKNDSTQ